MGGSWRVLFLVMLVVHAGCAYAGAPLPARPPARLVRIARSARPARPGYGVLALDTEDESARVYEIGRHGRRVTYEAILCTRTPCVVRLPVGRHRLAFSSSPDLRLEGAVVVTPRPSVAVVYEGETRSPGAIVLGVPIALLGSLMTFASLIIPFEASEGRNPFRGNAGLILFAASSSVLAGGVALIAVGVGHSPTRVGQWTGGRAD